MSSRNQVNKRSSAHPPKPGAPALSETRGYRKIFDASQALGVDFRNKIVLDIGSSTGGFTQYTLDHGAKKVIAVERGTNQMQAPLRFRSEVELHEKTNIFTFSFKSLFNQSRKSNLDFSQQAENIQPNPPGKAPDLILADVSFTSLTKILLYAKTHLASPYTEFLVMLKPQFEARPTDLKNGVIKNSKIRRTIIKNFETWLKSHGFVILGKIDNQLTGRTGNLERFYYLKLEFSR